MEETSKDLIDDLIKYLDEKSVKLFNDFEKDNVLSNDINDLSNQNLGTSYVIARYARINYSINLALEKAKIQLSNIEASISEDCRNNKHTNRGKTMTSSEIKDKWYLDEGYIKQLQRVKKLEALKDTSEFLLNHVKFRNSNISNQIEIIKLQNSLM